MKKFLLTVALVLAVVTSLTAGTMALYTQDLSAFSDDVTSKKFVVDGTQGGSFDAIPLHIAPGDSGWYSYTVTSTSEVPVQLTVNADITLADGTGFTKAEAESRIVFKAFQTAADVTTAPNPETATNLVASGAHAVTLAGTADQLAATDGTVPATTKYWLYVYWPAGDTAEVHALDTKMQGQTLGEVNIKVNATQIAEGTVTSDATPATV